MASSRSASFTLRRRIQGWVDARQPAARRHRLNRHCLYIFPSAAGFGFITLTCTLWVAGTNYENNLVLGLAFMLMALFVVGILHTFANLAGVSVQLVSAAPALSGEPAQIKLLLSREGQRPRDSIQLRWPGSETAVVSLFEQSEAPVSLFVPTGRRGWFDPGRLSVESRYPLGLLRCWTRLDMNCRVVVYPKPIPAGPLPQAFALRDEGQLSMRRGADEFGGFREYQPGDSLRNVAWKHFARGMGLHTKEYSAFVDNRLWLDWDYLAGMDREARLSRLCYWVLEASKTDAEFGLRLPGHSLPPGRGPEHREQALRMLALFEVEARA